MARTVKAMMAAVSQKYPATTFTLEPGRRGMRNITWTGGPDIVGVSAAIIGVEPKKIGYQRHNTPEEWAVIEAGWAREQAEREAAEPARRAKAKADGAALRQETKEVKAGTHARLAKAYPGVEFAVSASRGQIDKVAWIGGPSKDVVSLHARISEWRCYRTASDDEARDDARKSLAEATKDERCLLRKRKMIGILTAGVALIVKPKQCGQWMLPVALPRAWERAGGRYLTYDYR